MQTQIKQFTGFTAIEAPSLSNTVLAELFTIPETDSDDCFVLIESNGSVEPQKIIGFGLSLSEIDSQRSDALLALIETDEHPKIERVNLDIYVENDLINAGEDNPRPSATVRVDYAVVGGNSLRFKAGTGLPVAPRTTGGTTSRGIFPHWKMLKEAGSSFDDGLCKRAFVAALKLLSSKDKDAAQRVVLALTTSEEETPTSSTTSVPSNLAGLAEQTL